VNNSLCQVSSGFDLDKLSSAVACIGDVQVGQHPLVAFVYWQSSRARLSAISQVTSRTHLLLKPGDLFVQFGIFADLIAVEFAPLSLVQLRHRPTFETSPMI
jgi:hypothetical protein